MIGRRALVTALAASLALPVRGYAQKAGTVPLVAQLSPRVAMSADDEAFRSALRERGYEEGRNIAFAFGGVAGNPTGLEEKARALIRLGPAVIFAAGSEAAYAAMQATRTIPIVFVSSDPVHAGLVPSLDRPTGNMTGVSFMNAEASAKRLELLHEIVPAAQRIAVIWNPADPSARFAWEATLSAGRALGLVLRPHETRSASEIEAALVAIEQDKAEALVLLPAPLISDSVATTAGFALHARLPAISGNSTFTQAGGLLSYGTSVRGGYLRAALHVERILKGAAPADLPIDQPTKFELVINVKTAKALGLAMPPALLARADEVIE